MKIDYNSGTNIYNFIKSGEHQTETALKYGVITSQRTPDSLRNLPEAESAKIISENENAGDGNYALTVLRKQSQPSAPVRKAVNTSPSFLEIFKSAFSELKRTIFDEKPIKQKKSEPEVIHSPEKGYYLTIPEKYLNELKVDKNYPTHKYSNPIPKGILVNIIA